MHQGVPFVVVVDEAIGQRAIVHHHAIHLGRLGIGGWEGGPAQQVATKGPGVAVEGDGAALSLGLVGSFLLKELGARAGLEERCSSA
jgi:hypothetical protein